MPGPDLDRIDDSFPLDVRPRGTLVIIVLFGVLFALVWLGTYFLVFLQRATPRP